MRNLTEKDKEQPIDYSIGIDYEKIRRIVSEEVREAIADLLRAVKDIAQAQAEKGKI